MPNSKLTVKLFSWSCSHQPLAIPIIPASNLWWIMQTMGCDVPRYFNVKWRREHDALWISKTCWNWGGQWILNMKLWVTLNLIRFHQTNMWQLYNYCFKSSLLETILHDTIASTEWNVMFDDKRSKHRKKFFFYISFNKTLKYNIIHPFQSVSGFYKFFTKNIL